MDLVSHDFHGHYANQLKIIGHHFSDIWKINKPGYCFSVRTL